jgi:hypothetical protein
MKSKGQFNIEIGAQTAKRQRKVYDLDTPAPEGSLYSEFAAVLPLNPQHEESGEFPRGLILQGHDNVRDAIADFDHVSNGKNAADSSCELMQVTIELPSEDMLAGEDSSGAVRLLQPSPIDTVAILQSSNPSVVGVPAEITVPAGQTVVKFPIMTSNPWRATARVLIQALLPDQTLFAKMVSVRYNLGMQVR